MDLISVKSSYWNRSANNLSISFGGGEAKTAEELKIRSTFKGWDFESTWSSLADKFPVLRLF